MRAVEIMHVHEGIPPSDGFLEDVTRTMAGAISFLLEEHDLPVPSLRLITTPDVMATTAVVNEALGLPPDRRSGPERVGGIVGGKCIVADNLQQAAIVITDQVHGAVDGLGKLHAVNMVAHELGHLAYGAVRGAALGNFPSVRLPWEVAGVIAVNAAEEYRVDQLAAVMTSVVLSPTDSNGNAVSPSAVILPGWLDNLPNALDEVVPDIEGVIWDYRNRRVQLDDLWHRVVMTSEGIALYLAHTEAHHHQENAVVESVEHPAVDLLEPLWRPLFDHLRTSDLILDVDDWPHDRARLHEIGRTGLAETWRRLGIVASPAGDTFHLAVGDPAT